MREREISMRCIVLSIGERSSEMVTDIITDGRKEGPIFEEKK